MPTVPQQESATGTYFRRQDYAGFARRSLVEAIDLSVMGIMCLFFLIVLAALSPLKKMTVDLVLIVVFALLFGYFVVLKRSSFRTLGYRAGHVRIVGLNGETPGWSLLTLRFLFIFLGPLNWMVDLVFAAGDECGQTIHDKFVATYIVKVEAEPAGNGRVVQKYWDLFGLSLLLLEIERPELTDPRRSPTAPAARAQS